MSPRSAALAAKTMADLAAHDAGTCACAAATPADLGAVLVAEYRATGARLTLEQARARIAAGHAHRLRTTLRILGVEVAS